MDLQGNNYGIYSRFDTKESSESVNKAFTLSSDIEEIRKGRKRKPDDLDSDASTIDGDFNDSTDIIVVDNCDDNSKCSRRVLPVKLNPFASVNTSKSKSIDQKESSSINNDTYRNKNKADDKADRLIQKNCEKSKQIDVNGKSLICDDVNDIKKQILIAQLEHEELLFQKKMEIIQLEKETKLIELESREMERNMIRITYERKTSRHKVTGKMNRKESNDLVCLDEN